MRHWKPELLEQLLQVQDVDLEIRALDEEILDIYRKSKEEDQLLAQLKRNQEKIEESIITCEAQHEMYVGTLEDIRTAIKGLATTKAGAPKPRTRSSTEALRAEEEKLSALVLETEEQTKQLAEERINTAKQIEERSEEVERLQQGPEAEIRKLRNKIKKFEKLRTDAVQNMPSMLLRKYDRLRSSRSGVGLTTLRHGVCIICRMRMPTAIEARLNNGEMIPSCPACGRMVAKVIINYPKPSEIPKPAVEQDEEDTDEAPTAEGEEKAAQDMGEDGTLGEENSSQADEDTLDDEYAEGPKPAKKKSGKKIAAKKTASKSSKKKAAKKAAPKKAAASKPSKVQEAVESQASNAENTDDKAEPPSEAEKSETPVKKVGSKKTATKKTAKKTGQKPKVASKKSTKNDAAQSADNTDEEKKTAKKTEKKTTKTAKAVKTSKSAKKSTAKKVGSSKTSTSVSAPSET